MKKTLLFLLCLFSVHTYAQDTLQAVIKDRLTKEAVAGAVVSLLNTDSSVISRQITKPSGTFRFIRTGGVYLRITSIGYHDTLVTITGIGPVIYVEPNFTKQREVVVTAQRHISLAQDVPVSVARVEARELSSRSPQTIDQTLRFIPGVTVTEDQVSIRGSSGYARAVGSRVLFLLDGMPFTSADNGDIKFDALPMINIDHIEVVKGAGSALYGSSALGGIINVITREPSESFHGAVNAFGGFYDEPRYEEWKVFDETRKFAALELGATGSIGEIGLLGSLAYRRNEGYRLGDDYFKWSGFAKSTIPIGDETKLTLTGLFADDDHGGWLYWRSLADPLMPSDSLSAVNGRIRSQKGYGAVSVRSFLSDFSTLTGKAGVLHTNFTTDPIQAGGIPGAHSSATGYNLDLEFSTSALPPIFLTTGLTGTVQTVNSDLFQTHKGYLFGGFAQGEYGMEPFTFTAGIRADGIKYDTSAIIGSISPKLGVSVAVSDEIRLRGSFGTGFRAPTMSEQFTDQVLSGFTVKPNPSLKPEYSSSFEVGSSYGNKWLQADGAVFYSRYTDLIEPGFVSTGGSPYIQFRNLTNAEIFGHEEFVEFFPLGNDSLSLRAAYTYVFPRDITSHQILNFRPRHLLQVRSAAIIGQADFSTDVRYVSKYEAVDSTLARQVPNGDARVNAYILDIRAGYDLTSATGLPLKVIFQVQNLLNYYYVEIVGNMAPLRNYTLRFESSF
jgi:outer membrane receptor for ferrienterochelin and colicins